jgi:crotonobetainyl-CoA:carnitine CoA-transferase CaiB-like acyl-CoA transferase
MQPLAGIRVLDLTRVLSGPYATMTLGDLGAEVIKVEPPQGDDTRHWGPPFVAGESTYYLSTNRNKRDIVLDLKTDLAKRVIWDLIARSDVVLENFRPGALDRLGFGWETLHARHPRVILVSLSGYGQTGPYAQQPGYDLIAQAEGGLMAVTGEPGRAPVKVGFSIADIGTGLWAVIGTLAALRARDVTGVGDHVDVSLLETVVALQTYQAQAYLMAGVEAGPLGSAHPTVAPYQVFAASDGYFALGVGNDALYARLCDLLDSLDTPRAGEGEAWYRAPEYVRNTDRIARRDEVAERLGSTFRTRPRHMWLALLAESGIPAAAVNSVGESLRHPQMQSRGMVRTVEHPTVGPMPTVRMPITFSEAELATPTAPPLHGADTEAVLRELGYDGEQIRRVLDDAVPKTR